MGFHQEQNGNLAMSSTKSWKKPTPIINFWHNFLYKYCLLCMPALFQILSHAYYAQNYAGIINEHPMASRYMMTEVVVYFAY